MRLTAFTDISLRIVMRLAVADPHDLLTTRVAADLLAVPYTHAAKAVARLSELGVVEARRGRGGGLQLTAAGREATVGGLRRITVKRAGDGEVSSLLHATAGEGVELTLSAPFGDVALDGGEAPLVLVSAGIGCTPITAMLEHLALTGDPRRVLVLHADRSPAAHALRADMERLADALPGGERIFWYEEGHPRTGRMSLEEVDIPAGAVVYMCGPVPFMRAARGELIAAGVAPRDIHYEVFGPDLWLGAA